MNITIANISTQVSAAQLQSAVSAIGQQITQHFEPEWHIAATLNGTALSLKGKAPIQQDTDAIIYLGDSSQDPTTGVQGALGYHATNHAKIPYGFIYLDICEKYGEVWTCTLSHEVLELLGDPDAVMTVTGPAPKGKGKGDVYYDLEVCDPTQGDSYKIGDVVVSNFVGRSYFGMTGGSGNTNYLKLPLTPFGVRPKGYFQYEDKTGAHQVYGKQVTKSMLAAKALMEDGRRNERRKERLEKAMKAARGAPSRTKAKKKRSR